MNSTRKKRLKVPNKRLFSILFMRKTPAYGRGKISYHLANNLGFQMLKYTSGTGTNTKEY
jgi:hypothetical protein